MNDDKINLPKPIVNDIKSVDLNSQPNHNNPLKSTRMIQVLDAKDSDLIEKHWVDKVKDVFRQNRGKPFNQLNEYSQIKEDYLLKRFNKSIEIEQVKSEL
jgi:hypothetical protein